MKKEWTLYAFHILESIERIAQIVERGSITKDVILYDAALRNLQTLSEATRHLPESKKALFPEIPWQSISGFRNILVHDYLGAIDSTTIEQVIVKYLDPLEQSIRKMLKTSD